MKTIFLIACFLFNSFSEAFQFLKVQTFISKRQQVFIKFSSNKDNEKIPDVLSSDVQETMDKIMLSLSNVAPSSIYSSNSKDIKTLENDINQNFNKILEQIRDSPLSEVDKAFIESETRSHVDDLLSPTYSSNSPVKLSMKSLPTTKHKTSIFSDQIAPLLLVYGPGLVGQKCKEIAEVLGKSSNIKLLRADQLSILQDNELKFNIRDIKNVIIAADDISNESKGWFGTSQERKYCVDDKSLKKLLNAIMKERNKREETDSLKVVWFGNAIKESKSFVSLIAGDSSSIDSEFILQCNQRGFGYTSILSATVLPDGDSFPTKAKLRSSYELAGEDLDIKESPVVMTFSKSIESSEYSRVSDVAYSLFRAVGHPNKNSTITVVSRNEDHIAVDDDWDDQFLKLDGPELHRIALSRATPKQAMSRLSRLISTITRPNNGLITPIEITRYNNGIEIVFVPKVTSYMSANEERKAAKITSETSLDTQVIKSSKYISPEKDIDPISIEDDTTVKSNVSNRKSNKLEGGLQIFVDSEPYARVRIRRCNIGADTVVKVESEALIIKYIISALRSLENDLRLLSK